jgi:hypothetical protein
MTQAGHTPHVDWFFSFVDAVEHDVLNYVEAEKGEMWPSSKD